MKQKLIIFLLLLFNYSYLNSQDIQISYQAENRLLSQILNDLEKQYEIYFAFEPGQIRGKRANITVENEPMEVFLKILLKPLNLVFERVEEKFISIQKPGSLLVKAQITDAESGEALPFTAVQLKDSNLGAIADDKGRFHFIVGDPTDAVLQFSFLGYQTYELPLNDHTSDNFLNISLQPKAKTLHQVVIKEYINSGIAADNMASSFTILPQEMEVLPGLSERDILISSQIISGVNSNDESASGFNIRGSSRDNTFMYWNNIPIYHAAHYFGNISSFIPSSVGEVNIYKNYIPVSYGGASSGLVTIQSRTSLNGEQEYEASLNMTHGDIYAKLPFQEKNGALMIAARRSYNDWMATPTFNTISDKLFEGSITQELQQDVADGDFNYNSKLNFSDLNLKWHYEPTTRSTWAVSLLHSSSVLDYDAARESLEDRSIQKHKTESLGANLDWSYRISDNLATNISASTSKYEMKYNLTRFRTEEDETDNDVQSQFNTLNNIELRSATDLQVNTGQVLRFGYQMNHYEVLNRVNEDNFLEEDADIQVNSKGFTHSAFGEFDWDVNEQLEVIGGIRANYYAALDEMVFDPQIRLHYKITDPLIFKSSYGIYHQYLSTIKEADFTFSNTVEQHWVLANTDGSVPVLLNTQAVLGFLFENNGWLLDIDFYRKEIEGLLAGNFNLNVVIDDNMQGSEEILGIDLTLRKRWKKLRAWVSYSFQDSKLEFDNNALPNSFPSSLNIRHQLQISGTLEWRGIELSAGYIFKTGLPYTQANGLTLVREVITDEEEEEEEVDEYYKLNYLSTNAIRLPHYHRLDLSAWYKFPKKKAEWSGEIGISLINVLNRENIFRRSYTIEETEEEEVVQNRLDKFLLGFTPNISVRLRF